MKDDDQARCRIEVFGEGTNFIYGVEEDVARLGCRNWKIVDLNREGWRKLLKEAEAHPGL